MPGIISAVNTRLSQVAWDWIQSVTKVAGLVQEGGRRPEAGRSWSPMKAIDEEGGEEERGLPVEVKLLLYLECSVWYILYLTHSTLFLLANSFVPVFQEKTLRCRKSQSFSKAVTLRTAGAQ